MQLIIIHGNALSAIGEALQKIKRSYEADAVTVYTGKNNGYDQTIVALSTPLLFTEKQLAILEGFDEKIELEKLPTLDDLTIVIKFQKLLPVNSQLLKKAAGLKAKILLFSEKDEISVFPFLDALAERNKKAYILFEPLYKEFGGQYILTMICYLLRRLILPAPGQPAFVQEKILRQKNLYTEAVVAGLYYQVLETDYKIKTGLIEEKSGLTLIVENFVGSSLA